MKLSESQRAFSRDITTLMGFILTEGFEMTLGDFYRSPQEQRRLYNYKRSRVDGYKIIGRHQQKLAADIFLWKDGQVTWDLEDYRAIGTFWKSLDPKNVWGGDWPTLRDAVHFERVP